MTVSSTIVAPATGQGRAGVAIIRISGPGTRQAMVRLAGEPPPPRVATLRRLVDPRSGEAIDRGLVLWFPGPASFTGEDMAELHVHGGRSVIAAALDALIQGCGCAMAEPGDFARRAFNNGKLDLPAVEGLADLIDAETEAQRKQALRQLDGALGRQVERWSAELLDVLAWAEAALDFSDEADVPARSLASALSGAAKIRTEIATALEGAARGERLREGFFVVIAGPPNVGKSTLLNALARREVAIVSPIAGTTRDALEVRLDLGGLPVTLIDVAGIRDSSDPIEQEGIARARNHIARADLVLWLQSAESTGQEALETPDGAILVRTKVDLSPRSDSEAERCKGIINLSVATGQGLSELLELLEAMARNALGGGDALVVHQRQRQALASAMTHMVRASEAFEAGIGEEMVAEDLRLALRELGRVTGRVDVEEILGAIFSRFCIGK